MRYTSILLCATVWASGLHADWKKTLSEKNPYIQVTFQPSPEENEAQLDRELAKTANGSEKVKADEKLGRLVANCLRPEGNSDNPLQRLDQLASTATAAKKYLAENGQYEIAAQHLRKLAETAGIPFSEEGWEKQKHAQMLSDLFAQNPGKSLRELDVDLTQKIREHMTGSEVLNLFSVSDIIKALEHVQKHVQRKNADKIKELEESYASCDKKLSDLNKKLEEKTNKNADTIKILKTMEKGSIEKYREKVRDGVVVEAQKKENSQEFKDANQKLGKAVDAWYEIAKEHEKEKAPTGKLEKVYNGKLEKAIADMLHAKSSKDMSQKEDIAKKKKTIEAQLKDLRGKKEVKFEKLMELLRNKEVIDQLQEDKRALSQKISKDKILISDLLSPLLIGTESDPSKENTTAEFEEKCTHLFIDITEMPKKEQERVKSYIINTFLLQQAITIDKKSHPTYQDLLDDKNISARTCTPTAEFWPAALERLQGHKNLQSVIITAGNKGKKEQCQLEKTLEVWKLSTKNNKNQNLPPLFPALAPK